MKSVKIKNMKIGEGMPKIAVSILEKTKRDILEEARRLITLDVEIVEFRADYFEKVSEEGDLCDLLFALSEIFEGSDKALLFTLRTRVQGGLFCGDEFCEYERINKIAINSGAIDLIDIELPIDLENKVGSGDLCRENIGDRSIARYAKERGVLVIGSYHDFEKTPSEDELRKVFRDLEDQGADISKIAVKTRDDEDVERLIKFSLELKKRENERKEFVGESERGVPYFVIGMGIRGEITRLAGEILGSAITFANAKCERGDKEAQSQNGDINSEFKIQKSEIEQKNLGQPRLNEARERMLELHKFIEEKEAKGTCPIALLGSPVSHSFSKKMQNAVFEELGIAYRYYTIDTANTPLGALLLCLDELGFAGYCATKPCKNEIVSLLGEKDESVEEAGSCNTVVLKGGKRIGYNTDGIGAIRSLEEDNRIDLKDKKCLCLGAGGTAKAVCVQLAKKGVAKIYISSKSDSCEELAKRINKDFDGLCEAVFVGCLEEKLVSGDKKKKSLKEAVRECDIIFNLTGIGMYPNIEKSPLPKEELQEHQICFDATYNPAQTGFLKGAKKKGCQTINGEGMLIYQAAEQIKLWTGEEAPIKIMQDVIKKCISPYF